MASFAKFNANSMGRLFQHNNRTSDDGVEHSNENIDTDKTIFNYSFKYGGVDDVHERLEQLYRIKKDNAVVLGEFVVTLPKNVEAEDERDFFAAVYDFYCEDLGEKNIINAIVHKDEVTPHIHIDFVPVMPINAEDINFRVVLQEWRDTHDGENPTERLCCKDLINRNYLSQMHPRLQAYVSERLGYEVEIQNGATINGNKTVLQLKADNLQQKIETLEKRHKAMVGEVSEMVNLIKKHGFTESEISLLPLMQKIDVLEHQNAILKDLITRKGYSWSKADLEAMRAKEYKPVKSAKVSVFDGSLVNATIDDNAIIIIELPDQASRASPQQKLIDRDEGIRRQSSFVQSSNKQVMMRPARTTNNVYLFIKTDNERQTIDGLLLVEEELRKISDLKSRRIYIDKIETDKYELARSVLSTLEADVLYFNGRPTVDKQKGNEQGLSQEL